MEANFKVFIDNFSNNLKLLLDEYETHGFEIRVIGGAVRDVLMGQTPRDIDLATNALPTESLYLLHELARKTKDEEEIITARGIRHGTVIIAFSENEQYEITSLDFKMKVHNGRIVISQTPDWNEDAQSRDFTVNSMSMDTSGNIYDYINGMNDLRNSTIRFIGNFKERIKDDPILVLRFFKLMAKFENPQYDPQILDFIQNNLHLLEIIKPDTMKWFIANTKSQRFGKNAIEKMQDVGITVEQFEESVLHAYLKKAKWYF